MDAADGCTAHYKGPAQVGFFVGLIVRYLSNVSSGVTPCVRLSRMAPRYSVAGAGRRLSGDLPSAAGRSVSLPGGR